MRRDPPLAAPRAHRTSEAGLSLIEALITIFLLSFVGLGLMMLVTSGLHLNALAEERSIATSLASGRLQQMASLPFQPAVSYTNYRLPEEIAAAGPPHTFTADYGTIPGYPDYKRVVTLNYGTPVAGLLSVEVQVFWRHASKGEKSHEMVTFIHPGIG